MSYVHINTAGFQRLQQKVTDRIERLRGHTLRRHVVKMADEIIHEYNRTIDNFTPGTVKDLSPKYKVQKAQEFGHVYPILKASGAMAASMYHEVKVRSRGAIYSIKIRFRGNNGKITNRRLAMIHITGEGKMPARDFTKLPPGFAAKWTRRILAELRRK